jgi:hypothetical protein
MRAMSRLVVLVAVVVVMLGCGSVAQYHPSIPGISAPAIPAAPMPVKPRRK